MTEAAPHAAPSVDGILTGEQIIATARAIVAMQEPSGAIPFTTGQHADIWNHVEAAMALLAAGLVEAGLGVAAVPSMAMPGRNHHILTSVPLVEPVVNRRVGILRRRGRPLTPAAQEFHKTIVEMRYGAAASADRSDNDAPLEKRPGRKTPS